MAVTLNHTIVRCSNQRESAQFYADVLGLAAPTSWGPFWVVDVSNGISLDFDEDGPDIQPQHYAFLVSEEEFDEIFGRLLERGLPHWADPFKQRPGEINTNDGGRGVYWHDPDGHFLEIITVPYGGR
jgi:catechol 2,3-dioxygenase-like lactoylglutathione lyase family enzyme